MLEKIDFEKSSFQTIAMEIAKHYTAERKDNSYVFRLRSGEGKEITRDELEKQVTEKLSNYYSFPEKESSIKAIRALNVAKFIIDLVINLLGFIREHNPKAK